jgi:hypothetical protein
LHDRTSVAARRLPCKAERAISCGNIRGVQEGRDAAFVLDRDAAIALLRESGQPLREAALELDARAGGARFDGLTVGLASLRVRSPDRHEWAKLGWYAARDFVQVGCDFGKRAQPRLPAIYWMDESGWIHEDVALDAAMPVASCWQEWLNRLLDEGPAQIRVRRHTEVIAVRGIEASDVVDLLDVGFGPARGESAVVWDASVAAAYLRLVDVQVPPPYALMSARTHAGLDALASSLRACTPEVSYTSVA